MIIKVITLITLSLVSIGLYAILSTNVDDEDELDDDFPD